MAVGSKTRVICLDTGLVYRSLRDAAEAMGIKRHGIGRVCRGLQPKAGGHAFRYATDDDALDTELVASPRIRRTKAEQRAGL